MEIGLYCKICFNNQETKLKRYFKRTCYMNYANINALARDLTRCEFSFFVTLLQPLSLFRPLSLSFSLTFRFKWAIMSLVELSKFCHLEQSFLFTRHGSTNACIDYLHIHTACFHYK